MRDLLVAVPSRGRPDNLARLMDAMADTCRGDTHLVVGLDTDDPERWAYPEGPEYEVRPGLRQVVGWLNALIVPRVDDYRFVGHLGDDNVPRTIGWDVRIMEALRRTPFAFGNDLYPLRTPGSLATHVFTRVEVVTALGYFGPPVLRHMYVDNAWQAWGEATGMTFLPDVVIEHLHYTVGKAPVDESYTASSAHMATDAARWSVYVRDPAGLVGDIARIRQATEVSV